MDKTQRKIERELKKRERQERWQQKIDALVAWCEEHPFIALTGFTALLGAIGKIFNTVVKVAVTEHQLKQEKELKECYIYNRSTGMYDKLKKPLTGSERVELDARHSSGETTTKILNEMGKIKK